MKIGLYLLFLFFSCIYFFLCVLAIISFLFEDRIGGLFTLPFYIFAFALNLKVIFYAYNKDFGSN